MKNISLFNKLVFFAFTVSGLAALVYQSIWSKYLGLLLGHAAYAQSLVLIIFMGGLALGAWVAGRYSQRWRNLLAIYAYVEAIVGIMALVFHYQFDSSITFLFEQVLPTLNSTTSINVFKWSLAALLILPQTILLGMTFPILSVGMIRLNNEDKGRSISLLYFTNSLGAGFGALIAVFYLLPLFGLPGAMQFAGILSILVALVIFVASRKIQINAIKPDSNISHKTSRLACFMFFAAALTGAASFAYEIIWIRVLNLVLGTSIHVFEIVLSAFILGLAFGGLAIRKKIDLVRDTASLIAWAQILMGVSALLSIPLFVTSFAWTGFLVESLAQSSSGYSLFNIFSAVISMSIMLPATFFAGMTLPLMTVLLLKKEKNTSAIGFVYASNTLGGILGILLVMHVGLPALGVKYALIVAAVIDIALGFSFLIFLSKETRRKDVFAAATSMFLLVFVVTLFVEVDPLKMSSGIYRYGRSVTEGGENLFYKDGKTATIALTKFQSGGVAISTNGKPDALIMMDPNKPARVDEVTMITAGTFPFLFTRNVENVANIGFGSGQTTHTLLANKNVKILDSVEIEKEIIEAARGYGRMNRRAYTDPRSHIHIDDAKTYFSGSNNKYGIIVSEPSNPWVSGVAGLFSVEFYQFLKQHMVDDSIFVQWVQLYEINTPLVSTIFKALGQEMSDYLVFNTDRGNILILSRKQGKFDEHDFTDIFLDSEVKKELGRVGIYHLGDIAGRFLGSKKILQPFFDSFKVSANSDYYPVLTLNAPRARFMRASATELMGISAGELPVLDMLVDDYIPVSPYKLSTPLPNMEYLRSENTKAAQNLYSLVTVVNESSEVNEISVRALGTATAFKDCPSKLTEIPWSRLMHEMAVKTIPYLATAENEELWDVSRWKTCRFSEPEIELQLALYNVLASKNPQEIFQKSLSLLESENNMFTDNQHAFFVDAAMLGALSMGESEQALAVEKKYSSMVYAEDDKKIHRRLLKSFAESFTPTEN
jgi:predicted membrane-bound spermidine synthase